MSSSFFDIVVVGTELSGLVYAALAAKQGYRVLVLGHGGRTNRYEYRGYPFLRSPDVFYALTTSPVVESVLVDLGLKVEVRNHIQKLSPLFQFATPDARIDFDADPAVLGRELEREFPGQIRTLERYLRALATDNAVLQSVLEDLPPLPPEGFRERRVFRRMTAALADLEAGATDPLREIPVGHPLRAMLNAPLPFLAQPDLQSMPYIQRLRAAVHAAQGFQLLEGGLDRLRAMLIDRVEGHCGAFRPDAVVERFVMARSRVKSIEMKGIGEEVGCRLVACNGDPKRFFQLVPQERQRQRYHTRIRSLQPTHHLATMNFALRGTVVQEGMSPVVFFVADPARPLDDENLLLLYTDPREYEREGVGPFRVLTVTCRIRARDLAPRPATAREVEERVARATARFVPFLQERTLARHLTWQSPTADSTELDMTEVRPLYSGALAETLDSTILSCTTDYKNVLVGGDTVFSGLGLEGAFVAGRVLLRHTASQVVLKNVLDG